MDLSEKEKFGLDKDGDENQPSYHQSGISADCQMGLVHTNSTSMVACQRNQMGASSFPLVSMVDSFCPTLWDHQSNAQKSSIPLDGSSSNNVPIIKPIPGPSRLAMAWNPPDRKSKGIEVLPQSSSGMLPHGLSQFPTDLAFIERAARFSCFGGGNFAGMRSPNDSPNPYLNSRGATGFAGTQPQRDESNMMEHSNNPACMIPGSQRSNGSCLMNSQKETINSQELGEHGETEFSGSWQEEPPSSNGLAARKRKRNAQEMEIDQAKEEPSQQTSETSNDKNGTQLKDEQNNSSLCAIKNNGKQANDATDPPKEDYIHIRARRGQATNSHSLAERVRREKISERMKFLQDLVPGCSKVTGKAVMLDEIINYVQSLQRQVEFLSMKLATVNPPLDNIEGLLSKDLQMLQSQSATGFSPDFTHPFLNPTSQGLLQSGISGVGPSADVFRRVVNAQLVSMNPFKDVKHQVPNSWDDELHNVLSQMAFGSNLPLSIQDSNDKTCDGFPI